MLGRLARYLRFVGYDTAYVRGISDDELIRRARAEGRRIVTRDRQLSVRAPGSVLLRSPAISGQWAELRAAVSDLAAEVRFVRCTECNGELRAEPGDPLGDRSSPTYAARNRCRCTECGHVYWEGSHTAAIRQRLARWTEAGGCA